MLEVNNGDLKDCGDGHGVYATLARPGSRAMSWLYPSTGLSEVLLARSSQRGVLGTAPGQEQPAGHSGDSSWPEQPVPPCAHGLTRAALECVHIPWVCAQPLSVCTSHGCVHSPWVCAQPSWPAALPSLLPARLPHASGPRHPVIAISGQDAIPADAIPLAASFISPHQQRGG